MIHRLRRLGDHPRIEISIGRFQVENGSLVLDALEEPKTIVGKRIRYLQSRAASLLPRRPAAYGDHPVNLPRRLGVTTNPAVGCPTFGGHSIKSVLD